MKIRRAKIKLATERCSNTREMRRKHSRRVRHTHTQAGLMMVPPPSESMAMVSPHDTQYSRGTVRPQHNPDSSGTRLFFFFFFGGEGER